MLLKGLFGFLSSNFQHFVGLWFGSNASGQVLFIEVTNLSSLEESLSKLGSSLK
jgi:hypothetical protein